MAHWLKRPQQLQTGLIPFSSIANSFMTLGQIPSPVYTSISPSGKGDNFTTPEGGSEDKMSTLSGNRAMINTCASQFLWSTCLILRVSKLRLC